MRLLRAIHCSHENVSIVILVDMRLKSQEQSSSLDFMDKQSNATNFNTVVYAPHVDAVFISFMFKIQSGDLNYSAMRLTVATQESF